jgi:uncharacterized RDD family membrane protein YckC
VNVPPLPEPPSGSLPPPPPDVPSVGLPVYATFWQRVGARLLDGLLLSIPLILVVIGTWSDIDTRAGLTQQQRDSLFRAGLVVTVLSGVYEITLTALRGQTLGKMALGIKVLRAEDRGPVGWGRAAVRWIVPTVVGRIPEPAVSTLGTLLVYLWMLWDPMRQGLHDKAARTIVVRIRS